MTRPKIPTIVVVSDGRGETCQQVVNAAVVQFEGQPFRLVRRGNVRSPGRVRAIVRKAAAVRAIVFYTLVGDETRQAIRDSSAEWLVPTVDVLGPAFSALHDLFKTAPRSRPGLLYSSNRERFDRHEAIDYTLRHDDGQHLDDLAEADVVVVGVSRASKTSTCFYLAYEGVKAANVPLVPGIPPPAELLSLDPARVVGLRMNVMRLATVRQARARSLAARPTDDYLEERAIAREVLAANRLMNERGWRSLDASYLAVEEIAREILVLRGLKPPRGRG